MSVDSSSIKFTPTSSLPLAYGDTSVTGVLRQHPEYFYVEEKLGFEPEGEGEHVFLLIEKIGMNTQYLADQLASFAGVAKRQVSYAGMKDRHAVTRQWFSVHLPGNKKMDWSSLNTNGLTVLKAVRHRKKLRRGIHKGNIFRIKLTELKGDLCKLENRLKMIKQGGVPNYFGEQRFGHKGANLVRAQQWFEGGFSPKRHQQGIYLSAARSYLFNQVLAKRVTAKSWSTVCAGELLMLNGSRSVFSMGDENITERLNTGDIHPTGPLYGQAGNLMSSDSVAQLEQSVFNDYQIFVAGLEKAGLKQERRALRVIPTDLSWGFTGDTVELSFYLPRGCFATAFVRELVNYY